MVITHHGNGYFRIQSGELTVLIDPENSRSLKGATVVINTVKPPKISEPKEGEFLWIENEGEYEIQGIRVNGFTTETNGILITSYRAEIEGISIVILGPLAKEPASEKLADLEGADILIAPSGEPAKISPDSSARLVRQLEPGIVIPSFSGAPPKKFLSALGASPEPEEKLVVKKKDIVPELVQVRLLTVK